MIINNLDDDDTADHDRDHVAAVVAAAVDQNHIEQNLHWRLTI